MGQGQEKQFSENLDLAILCSLGLACLILPSLFRCVISTRTHICPLGTLLETSNWVDCVSMYGVGSNDSVFDVCGLGGDR
jgi:hypothetical protein